MDLLNFCMGREKMAEVRLDGEMIQDKAQLHNWLAEELGFPSWYGRNLDALYDCLTDIRDETRLVIFHSERLAETLGPYMDRLLEVLHRAEREDPRFFLCIE